MVDIARAVQQGGVLYERDTRGQIVAIEILSARRWSPAFLEPPDPTRADVRVIMLASGRAPEVTPAWLGIAYVSSHVAEDLVDEGTYASRGPREEVARRVARGLVPATGALTDVEFADFLAAGAAAVRHPGPVPAESHRRIEVIRQFARGRAGSVGVLADLADDLLEWRIMRGFGTPDAFSLGILLERLRDSMPEVASTLRALTEARISESTPEWTELALDRRALLALASPWRIIEGADGHAAVSAVRTWLRRHESARQAEAERWRKRANDLRGRIDRELSSVRALERLNSIALLGPPHGEDASVLARRLHRELLAFDPTADSAAPLGHEPTLFAQVEAAFDAVRGQLESARQRLASATVSVVLDQPGGPDVSRLLQAIQACDIDGIERALDARLAAHIEAVLDRRSTTPLRALAARYAEVDADNLEAVVAAFHELLADAVSGSTRGSVPLV